MLDTFKHTLIVYQIMAHVTIIELTTPGCHICAEAKKFFEGEFKLQFLEAEVRYVSVLEEEGQALVLEHSIFASPAIFINGELISTGGFSKKNIIEKVKTLLAQ